MYFLNMFSEITEAEDKECCDMLKVGPKMC